MAMERLRWSATPFRLRSSSHGPSAFASFHCGARGQAQPEQIGHAASLGELVNL